MSFSRGKVQIRLADGSFPVQKKHCQVKLRRNRVYQVFCVQKDENNFVPKGK